MERETRICDECEGEYYADTSEMAKLCPNCSHFLYGYDNCQHSFKNGRCENCYWNGETTKFIENLRAKKMTFSETIEWLSVKPIEDKILFSKLFLSDLTVMNRAIWDDNTTSDNTKLECLKRSNELAHRIWNLLFELEKGKDNKSENKLADHIRFHQQQSKQLAGHLAATFKRVIEHFIFHEAK